MKSNQNRETARCFFRITANFRSGFAECLPISPKPDSLMCAHLSKDTQIPY